jgi:gamma-glutamyltranspeptidase/glutathione hydrolase
MKKVFYCRVPLFFLSCKTQNSVVQPTGLLTNKAMVVSARDLKWCRNNEKGKML